MAAPVLAGSTGDSPAVLQAARSQVRAARPYRTVKGRMLAEFVDSLSHDPVSVRFLAPWIHSLLPGRNPIRDQVPWMNFKVIRWMRSYLDASMQVFEYGTGGSTLFLARRVRRLVSVESDPRWHAAVAQSLSDHGIRNCDLRLVPSQPPGARTDPRYVSTAKGVAGRDFRRYVEAIDTCEDGSLDLVLVDGYARLACVAHAVRKVREGGYLLVDDTDWKKYGRTFDLLRRYARVDFVGVTPFQFNLRQTSVWRIT